eukprot:15038395-Ditylum_brightwellii.AAC.1
MLREVVLKRVKGKKSGEDVMTLSKVEIGGGCNDQCKKLEDTLMLFLHAQYMQWTKAKCPLFSHPTPYICALSAVAIGCDDYCGGIKNLGVKEEDKDKGNITSKLVSFLYKRGKLEMEVLDTYVKALLCKPANDTTNTNNTYSYLYSCPAQLPQYQKEFSD